MEGGESADHRKRHLNLDINKLIDENDDFDAPEVLRLKKPKPESPAATAAERDEQLEGMTDSVLDDSIGRQLENLRRFGQTLPDKGERLRFRLKKLEDEKERRRVESARRAAMKEEEKTSPAGGSNGFKEEILSPPVELQCSFARDFCRKLGEDTDCSKGNAFDRELKSLGRRNKNNNGEFSENKAEKGRSSSRNLPCQSPINFYQNTNKSSLSNGDCKGRASSNNSGCHGEKNFSSSVAKREDPYQLRNRTKKSQTILLVDEEEPEFMDTLEQIEEIPESMKDSRIYYPTRDDPHSVEICYTDTKCLHPRNYLTSAIMNFYLRYLRQQASPAQRCVFHFFNTFFYNKLKDAVSEKGANKDDLFAKLRRWWKDVDIFQKAYILIPINEDLHWSLVIICIPDKEEESGPLVLHLDSLGLHSSKAIFRIIKSFIKEEWCYMDQEFDISDLTVSNCWKRLSDHIEEKRLVVPQQKNDYDCGLFVLFFVERFIEDAPERLKRKDLSRFGKQWFQPDEASRLRIKILKLLKEEFQNAAQSNRCRESSPLSDASEE